MADKELESGQLSWYKIIMKLTADAHSRIASPEFFRPNAAYDATKLPDGTIQLVELAQGKTPQARLIRRGGRTYLESDRAITNEDIASVVAGVN